MLLSTVPRATPRARRNRLQTGVGAGLTPTMLALVLATLCLHGWIPSLNTGVHAASVTELIESLNPNTTTTFEYGEQGYTGSIPTQVMHAVRRPV